MNNFYATLIAALTDWLTKSFGQGWSDFFRNLFSKHAETLPEPQLVVGVAPDEVKSLLRELITNLVKSALANKPFILKVALVVLNNLPDSFIDNIWDSLFAAKIAAGELPASNTFPVKTAEFPNPIAISEPDLAKCRAEAGMAA